jgi:hypothetical protein
VRGLLVKTEEIVELGEADRGGLEERGDDLSVLWTNQDRDDRGARECARPEQAVDFVEG